jgi:hypothetical protein
MEFNRNQLPKNDSYDLLPAGWTTARVRDAIVHTTKTGNSDVLDIQWEIVGPANAGRVTFGTIILKHDTSDKAEEIGLKNLNALLEANNLIKISVPDYDRGKQLRVPELVGKICDIKISVKPAEGKWEAKNEIKGYRSLVGSPLPTVLAASDSPAPAATAKKPWEK